MQITRITEFRPAKNSGAAGMREAIGRINDEKTAAEAALAAAVERRGRLLLTASPSEIVRNDANVAELRTYIEQLSAMSTDLNQQAAAAADNEQAALAEYNERAAKIDRRIAAWAKARATKYAAPAKIIQEWLGEEENIIDDQRDLLRRRAELVSSGHELPPVLGPFPTAFGTITQPSFGAAVRLPGADGGGGLIPIDMTPVKRKVQVRRPDWDAGGPVDGTGKPLVTKLVEEEVSEVSPRPIREDKPFWWPK